MFSRKNKKQQDSRRSVEGRSPASPVFSYSAQRLRVEDNTERAVHVTPKVKRNWFILLPSILSAIAIGVSFVYATTLTAQPRIVVIEETNSKLLRPIGFYEAALQDMLDDSVLNYSKLSIDTVGLAARIEQEYPELKNVSISLPLLGRRPVIQVQAATPAFILLSRQGSVLINAEGKAILHTQDTNLSGLGITSVTDESGLEVALGQTVLPKEDMDFITTVLYQLSRSNLGIQSVTLPAVSNEVHLRLQGRQYYVKFNLRGSALEQTGSLIAIQKRLESEGMSPVEYIDVRVEDRAYIK